jgi:hypothetical protein
MDGWSNVFLQVGWKLERVLGLDIFAVPISFKEHLPPPGQVGTAVNCIRVVLGSNLGPDIVYPEECRLLGCGAV